MDQRTVWITAFLILIITRLSLLGTPGLVDPSEGRFAVAAQQMVLTGDWVTPKTIAPDGNWEAYLAKPPLFMWLAGLSMKSLGINEFSSRLPSFLSMIGISVLLFYLVKHFSSELTATRSSFVFLSTIGAIIFHPVTITDPILNLWISAIIVGFVLGGNWYFLSAISCGLGILTKGPVAIVIPAGVILSWLFITKDWAKLKTVPWVRGIACVLAVVVPWIILMENVHPDFLSYYIIEENINRYLKPDAAIRYGTLHHEPYGMIWVFGAALMLPWLPILISKVQNIFSITRIIKDPLQSLGVCWMLFPLLFFTFAKQTLPTYAFPALPGFAILCSLSCFQENKEYSPFFKYIILFFAAVFLLVLFLDSGLIIKGIPVIQTFTELDWIRLSGAVIGAGALLLLAERRFNSSLDSGLLRWSALMILGYAVFGPVVSERRSGIGGIELVKLANLSQVSTPHLRAHSLLFYGANNGVEVKIYPEIHSFLSTGVSGEKLIVRHTESNKWDNEISQKLTLMTELGAWQLYSKN